MNPLLEGLKQLQLECTGLEEHYYHIGGKAGGGAKYESGWHDSTRKSALVVRKGLQIVTLLWEVRDRQK